MTDPPYGVKEYDFDQLLKRANGNGRIWRIPPSFDGYTRAPLPRFTAFDGRERKRLREFFMEWAKLASRALRPGAHVFIATNSFIAQLLYAALVDGGLEFRGPLEPTPARNKNATSVRFGDEVRIRSCHLLSR